MTYLSLVIWLIFYPLADSINNYFVVKRRSMQGRAMPSEAAQIVSNLLSLIVHVLIAVFLIIKA